MTIKWYHNAYTGEIDSYQVEGELTNFPRGVFLAYGDYITTGLKSKKAAEDWAKEWHVCTKCQSSRHGQVGESCNFCGTILIGSKLQ